MIDYQFVKYEGNYPRGDTKIAIHKSGIIRLSSGFCRITDIKNIKYVVLFYDRMNKAIALKFTNIRETGAMKVTKDRTGAAISAKSFMKANNANLRSYTGRYQPIKQTISRIGEVYIIELGK